MSTGVVTRFWCLSLSIEPETENNKQLATYRRDIAARETADRLSRAAGDRSAVRWPAGRRRSAFRSPSALSARRGRHVLSTRGGASHRTCRHSAGSARRRSRGHSRPAGQGSTGSVGARCRIKEPRQLSERKQQRSASVTTCPTTQFSCCSPLLYWRIFSRTLLLLTKKNPKRWSVKACSWTACEANRTEQNSSLVQFVCCKQTFNSINTLTVQPDCNFFSCNKLYHILTVLTSRKLVKPIGLDSINLTVIFNVWHWLHTSQ